MEKIIYMNSENHKARLSFLLAIRKLRKIKNYEYTLSQWEKGIGTSRGNPITRKLFKELINNNCIYSTRIDGYGNDLYKVDLKKLSYFIMETDTYKELSDFDKDIDYILPRLRKK